MDVFDEYLGVVDVDVDGVDVGDVGDFVDVGDVLMFYSTWQH